MVHEDSGGTWLGQLWQWWSWQGLPHGVRLEILGLRSIPS